MVGKLSALKSRYHDACGERFFCPLPPGMNRRRQLLLRSFRHLYDSSEDDGLQEMGMHGHWPV